MTTPQGPAPRRYGWASGPRVTYLLIGICIALFLSQQVSWQVVDSLAFSPDLAQSEPYRFLTAAFLHVNVGHLMFNMVAFFAVGQALEPILGRIRYLTLFILGAVGGNVAVLLWAEQFAQSWHTFVVGASGAIFAFFGAILIWHKKLGTDLRAILTLLAINLALPLLDPMISWQAHLGGLLTGICAAFALSTRRASKPMVNTLGAVLILLVLFGLAIVGYA